MCIRDSPNPAVDEVLLDMDLLFGGETTLSIQDVTGRILRVNSLGDLTGGAQPIRVNLSDLSTGAYWLRLQNASGELVVPVQKQ